VSPSREKKELRILLSNSAVVATIVAQMGAAPNTEMQIDIVFTPKIQRGTTGLKIATMSVTGPGPRGAWALSVPLHGVLNELKLGPPERVPPRSGARRIFVEPVHFAAN
jgi:hypothetical protein